MLLKNQKGFALILVLALAPFLLGGALLVSYTALVLKVRVQLHHVCRKEVLAAQKEVILPLRQLLRMNPRSQRLLVQKRLAEAALAAAIVTGAPPAIALARTRLARVIARQQVLAMKQEALLTQAQLLAGKRRVQTEAVLRTEISQIKNSVWGWLSLGRPDITVERSDLAVRKAIFFEISSPYKRLAHFEHEQKMKVAWQIPFSPLYFEDFFGISPSSKVMKGQCQATLTKEKRRWTPVLIEDRS